MELHFPNSIRLQNSTPSVSSSLLPQTIFHFFCHYHFILAFRTLWSRHAKVLFSGTNKREKQNPISDGETKWLVFVFAFSLALLDVFPCCWNLPSGSSSITILCVLLAELPSQFQSCVRKLRENQLLVKTFCFLPVFLTCSKMTIWLYSTVQQMRWPPESQMNIRNAWLLGTF